MKHLSAGQSAWLLGTLERLLPNCDEGVYDDIALTPMAGDASVRRYFTLSIDNKELLLVQAPHEQNLRFVHMTHQLQLGGLQVPEVFALQERCEKIAGLEISCALMQHLGKNSFWQAVQSKKNHAALYHQALTKIIAIQKLALTIDAYSLTSLKKETDLFATWFVPHLANGDQELLKHYKKLVAILLPLIDKQPRALAHKDFHSRNLMLMNNDIYLIDYQDALQAPLSYDLVSLLRDCYINIGDRRRNNLLKDFYNMLPRERQTGVEDFFIDFERVSIQRLLKVAGIFVRLWVRDGKATYLQHIPLCLHYLLCACVVNKFTRPFAKRLLPHFKEIENRIAQLQKTKQPSI